MKNKTEEEIRQKIRKENREMTKKLLDDLGDTWNVITSLFLNLGTGLLAIIGILFLTGNHAISGELALALVLLVLLGACDNYHHLGYYYNNKDKKEKVKK